MSLKTESMSLKYEPSSEPGSGEGDGASYQTKPPLGAADRASHGPQALRRYGARLHRQSCLQGKPALTLKIACKVSIHLTLKVACMASLHPTLSLQDSPVP